MDWRTHALSFVLGIVTGVFSKVLADWVTDARRGRAERAAANEQFYSAYLCRRYALSRVEALFEIPLDSSTAAGLRKMSDQPLSRWRGVRYVTPALNTEYQLAAFEAEI